MEFISCSIFSSEKCVSEFSILRRYECQEFRQFAVFAENLMLRLISHDLFICIQPAIIALQLINAMDYIDWKNTYN